MSEVQKSKGCRGKGGHIGGIIITGSKRTHFKYKCNRPDTIRSLQNRWNQDKTPLRGNSESLFKFRYVMKSNI
jgi:hypothetical protein